MVPDWRDVNKYGEHGQDQWRWQFLRRHPSYQADFDECEHVGYVLHGSGQHIAFRGRDSWPESFFKQRQTRHPSCEWLVVKFCERFEKYGLQYGVDWRLMDLPKSVLVKRGLFSRPAGSVAYFSEDTRFEDEHEDSPIQYVKVDLRHNISEQLAKARHTLEQVQSQRSFEAANTRKHQLYLWSTYLRVLDARSQRPPVTLATIANEILNSESNDPDRAGSKLRDRAERTRDMLTFV